MASTNKTTNYDLSQYVGSDKPSYLNDYNQDMSKIDLGIHAAKSEADTNATAIGDLSDLTTTATSDLVSAINEVDSNADTANATAVQADGKATTNATAIGTLANLNTTVKSDLVSATNEVNSKVGNIANLNTTEKSSTVGAINEVNSKINNFNLTDFDQCTVTGSSSSVIVSEVNVNCAKNSDGSLFKIYGNITLSANAWDVGTTLTITNTGLPAIDTPYDIFGAVLAYSNEGIIQPKTVTYNTDGSLTIVSGGFGNSTVRRLYLPPCLYFNANFGDTPE